MERFKLTIELGNDAMMDPADVAGALKKVAARLRDEGFDRGCGKIMDANGNSVGTWEVE